MSLGGLTGMSNWMIDTFVYTSLLIAMVLLLRGPVSRNFGPQIAYALWALPLLRFIMPPIVLPAWMAPVPEPTATPATANAEPLLVIFSDPAAETAASVPEMGVTVTDILLPLWLGGAVIFLGWRVREYIRMRRDLLADARPMGESGKIRLVETPAVSAPVAFGVRDKVVALPVDFMALLDVKARDMAIGHELEHHRGHDLLANIAAQPLLALHWFNPLAWWGWRAMRRDQEAACDARVVAGRARSERAAYAEVIAGFAAGEHLALAAPMACPVLGEKSIIHRLRSLTMSDVSSSRRKIGIAAITTTALALPLTASISYAAPEVPQDADAPTIETIDPDAEELAWVEQDEQTEREVEVIHDEDGERHVEVRVIRESEEGADGERRVVRRVVRRGDGDMSEAELEAMLAELEIELEGLDEEVERSVGLAMRSAEHARMRTIVVSDDEAGSHDIDIDCDGPNAVEHHELADGRRAMVICQTQIRAHAATGLRAAREAIANNPDLPAEMREEILRDLQEAEEEMRAARVSSLRVPKPPRPAAAPRTPPEVTAMRTSVRFNLGRVPAPPAAPAAPLAPTILNNGEDCDEATTNA